jgi:hypothetical protein
MAIDITYADWIRAIGDPAVATMITNASLPESTSPPAEVLWKLVQAYKKAQDEFNVENAVGTSPNLATVNFLQMGPAVEIAADNRPYLRLRAQVQCIMFLEPNKVEGVTII